MDDALRPRQPSTHDELAAMRAIDELVRSVREAAPSSDRDLAALVDLADRATELMQRARQEIARRESSEALLRAIFDGTIDAIITMQADGRITGWNAPAERMFGWLAEEMIGARVEDTIVPLADREAHRTGLAIANETGKGRLLGRRVEVTALHRDGHELPIELTITPITVDGAITYTAFARDITEQKRYEADLVRLATVDQLTGLLNRREFHRRLSDELIDPRNHVALLFVDLDGFKAVNDDHGHEIGDHVLHIVDGRIGAAVRTGDIASRYGGDEFTIAIIAQPYTGLDIEVLAADAATRLSTVLRQPVHHGHTVHHLTASIGVAIAPTDASATAELIRCADVAMYRAKQSTPDGGAIARYQPPRPATT